MCPYEFGVTPVAGRLGSPLSAVCTERVRAYDVRAYIKMMVFNTDSKIADSNALSMWMSHPLYEILAQSLGDRTLFCPYDHPRTQISPEGVYSRPSQTPPRCPLPLATALLGSLSISEWLLLHDVHSPLPPLYATPHILLYEPRPLAVLYDSDVSNKDDEDMTSADSAADEVGTCFVRFSYDDDPDLAHFVSVVDLQRTPGATDIDFSLFCLGMPAEGTGSEARRATRSPLPSPSPSPLPPLASGRPVRDSRANLGHSADLPLESDVNSVGLLPSSFVKVVTPGLHKLGPADTAFPGFKTLTSAPAGEMAFSSRFLQVVPYPRVPSSGSTRAATPKTSTLPTHKPNGGLPIVTMSSTSPRMELITKDPMAGGQGDSLVRSTRSLPTMTLLGGRRPTALLSAGTAFKRRPWPAASLTILSPGSVPSDDTVQSLPHVCPCLAGEDDVSYFSLAQCSYSLTFVSSRPPTVLLILISIPPS
jgi:hypothetical protein